MNIEDICNAVQEFEAAATKLNQALNNYGITAEVGALYNMEYNESYETRIQVWGECLPLLGRPIWTSYPNVKPFGYSGEVVVGNIKFHAWVTQEEHEAIIGNMPTLKAILEDL